jgi:hypothetical protein
LFLLLVSLISIIIIQSFTTSSIIHSKHSFQQKHYKNFGRFINSQTILLIFLNSTRVSHQAYTPVSGFAYSQSRKGQTRTHHSFKEKPHVMAAIPCIPAIDAELALILHPSVLKPDPLADAGPLLDELLWHAMFPKVPNFQMHYEQPEAEGAPAFIFFQISSWENDTGMWRLDANPKILR